MLVKLQEMISNFMSDDSFPAKTGSCPIGIVDLSFDEEYPILLVLTP